MATAPSSTAGELALENSLVSLGLRGGTFDTSPERQIASTVLIEQRRSEMARASNMFQYKSTQDPVCLSY